MVEEKAKKKNIIVTGFVPEEKVALYFSACDAVILPYTSFFSSSGPLALAIAYDKPILLSPSLSLYAKTPDFATALKHAAMSINDICVPITTGGITHGIGSILRKEKQIGQCISELKKSRNIDVIAEAYITLLFPHV